jgi:Na+/melibiose symporter-like transporter
LESQYFKWSKANKSKSGALAQFLGWRSIFYFLAIFGGVLFVIFLFFFPETCRNVVGNGSIPARGVNLSIIGHLQQRKRAGDVESLSINRPTKSTEKRKWEIPNPLTTLKILKDKESAIVLLYNGFFFNGQMIVAASLPYMLEQAYGYTELEVGLCFISLGMGSLLSALTMGHVVDWNFRRHAAKLGMIISKGKQQDLRNYPIERARLQIVAPNHALGTVSLIAFGWTIKYKTHISGPEIMLFFIGFGISTAFNTTNTLLIDLHRDKAATATAAVNFVRCMISAGGVAAIVPMIKAMNAGWAFTFVGLVYVLLAPSIWFIMKNGQRWRNEAAEKSAATVESARAATVAEDSSHEDVESAADDEKTKD